MGLTLGFGLVLLSVSFAACRPNVVSIFEYRLLTSKVTSKLCSGKFVISEIFFRNFSYLSHKIVVKMLWDLKSGPQTVRSSRLGNR